MDNNEHIDRLVKKALAEEASPEEFRELQQILKNDAEGVYAHHIEALLDSAAMSGAPLPAYDMARWDVVADHILMNDHQPLEAGKTIHRVHFLKTAWFRYAAALIMIAGIAAWMYFAAVPPNGMAIIQHPAPEIPPGGNRAILTLANGSRIVLDSAVNGNLARQGDTKIIKLNEGALAYNAGTAPQSVMYNVISTPRGGQYQVVLPDGSKVWLNAASSVRFPTAFTGSNRKIEITGEVYVEAAPDSKRPFFLSAGSTEVQVLGTSFNVNAYDDEPAVKTTLLEGSVRVAAYNQVQTLLPGQQAEVQPSGKQTLNKNINTQDVIAWKNGIFRFNNAKVPVVMRQIARWYDVEIVYSMSAKSDEEIIGEIQRKLTLTQMVNVLAELGIHCRIEDRKLIVL